MNNRVVTVFGGSGFVGRYVVRLLAASGLRVRVAVRDIEKAHFLKTAGDLGQLSIVPTSIGSDEEVAQAVHGSDWVVNTVGVLYERGSRSFQAIHVDGAARVAKAAALAGADRLVHISALGADDSSPSAYSRSKAAGEAAVLASFPKSTILRPSVIFGPEDGFFNLFADMGRITSVMTYFTNINPKTEDGGGTAFQPVFAGDVALAIECALSQDIHTGRIYDIGGPAIYDMRSLLEMINKHTDRNAWILGLPFILGRFMAFWLQFLPKPLLTPDQIKLLETDNVVDGSRPGLAELGITPTTVESILPTYLRRFRPYQQQKKLRIDMR